MSEEIIPEVKPSDVVNESEQTVVSPVNENVAETVAETVADAQPEVNAGEKVSESAEAPADASTEEAKVESAADEQNWSDKSLSDLIKAMADVLASEVKMSMSKEVESIKSSFYKKLKKEREDMLTAKENAEKSLEEIENPFAALEDGFKDLYSEYKKERAEYNAKLDAEREHNLELKKQVIEDLKALLEKQEDVNATFPEFREIQNRWREIGPVPATAYKNLNETYQLYVEQFYDMVQINRELRDLDFRKNLEAKQAFCEMAEKLSENENVVDAFNELQKLHEKWKEFGPVAKEYRDDIWNRFKSATSVINKKYQSYYEDIKEKQSENLTKKQALCEKVEEIAEREIVAATDWNKLSKEIEDIQKEWRTIGFASKKENQKIYDRFRAACDKFFTRKRDFYAGVKDAMNDNLEKKVKLCEEAEALKESKEWKKTTDRFIALQKQWKEIGAIPRKKSEQLWKRFRGAADEFFAERDKNAKPENDFYGNLKAKQALIKEVESYVSAGAEEDAKAYADFQQKWSAIGFVPFKEKDKVAEAWKSAVAAKFPNVRHDRRGSARAPRSEQDILISKFTQLEQNIATYENNIGFFSSSKNSESLVKQMQERIDAAKEELKDLAARISELQKSELGDN